MHRRTTLTCHCEERSDVAISQYPAASWESNRRNRNCLPEIAPQGHFLALRAQGATAPSGPRNDKSGNLCIRRCRPITGQPARRSQPARGTPHPYGGKAANGCAGNAATPHTLAFAVFTADCTGRKCAAGSGMPLPYSGAHHLTTAGTNWKCLSEIAPQGHFLALRAQGATSLRSSQ